MRITRRSPEAVTLTDTIARLGALADTGRQLVEIRTVMEWLGVTWREPTQPAARNEPGTDPMTGCKPVTARPPL